MNKFGILMGSMTMRRLLQGACIIAVIVYFISAFTLKIDADEFQMLILGAELFRGRELYVDLWDNHGPAISWILESLNHLFPWNSMSVFYIHRGIMLVLTFVSVWVGWRALCSLYQSKILRLFGLLFLLAWPAVYLKCIEIRADSYLHLIWGIALSGMVIKRNSTSALWSLLWGFIIGLGFFFSVKTLFVGMAFGIVLLGHCWVYRQSPIKRIIFGGIGSASSAGLLILILKMQGILDRYIELNFSSNFGRKRPEFFEGLNAIEDISFPWMLVLGLGMIYGFVLLRKHKSLRLILPYLSAGLLLLLVFAFALPTKYYQSLVFPALPFALAFPKIFSAFCAWIRKSYKKLSNMRLAVYLPIAMLLLGIYLTDHLEFGKLRSELQFYEAVQREIPSDAKVLSGYGAPPSRSHPADVTSWIRQFRDQVNKSKVSLPQKMIENEIQYIIYDNRLARMDVARSFMQRNYLPLPTSQLLVAGKAVPVNRKVQVRINIPGVYYFEPEYQVLIDGIEVTSPIAIEEGKYQFTVTANTTRSMRLSQDSAAFRYLPNAELNRYLLKAVRDRRPETHVAWPEYQR